jgi:pSer/pThr/pTyr-binding forkhead associated (FHA) protein
LWYIILYENEEEVGKAAIIEGQTISIGSNPENSIVVPGIDGEQSFIYLSEGYPVIEDSGNRSTILDGFPIETPSFVTNENQLSIGSYSAYVYFDDKEVQADFPPPPGDELPPPPDAELPPPPGDELPPPPENYPSVEPAYSDSSAPTAGEMSSGGEMEADDGYDPLMPYGESEGGASVQFGEEAVPVIENRTLKLIAREGYLDGREFLLAYDDYFDIGRSPNVEIVVDDPSISRVHARLKISEGGTLMVQDLRSTNGTYINGQDAKRDLASLGDRIRFGEIPFLFTTDKDGDSEASGFDINTLMKSKKFIFGIIGFVFFISITIIINIARKNKHKGKKDNAIPVSEKENYEAQLKSRVAKLKAEAKELTMLDNWDAAIVKYKQALSLFADDSMTKSALTKAKFERKNYRIYKKALSFKSQMTFSGKILAIKTFKEINKSSQYFQSMETPLIVQLKKQIARVYKKEGLGYYRKNWIKCSVAWCNYFRLDSKIDDIRYEDKYRQMLEICEKWSKRKKGFIPCVAFRFKNKRIPLGSVKAIRISKLIKAKYHKGIADAVLVYFSGNPKDAIQRLQELTKTHRGKRRYKDHLTTIANLQQQLQTLSTKFESGEGKLLVKDVEGAKLEWNAVLIIDKAIIPAGIKSRVRKNVANRLAERFYIDGKNVLGVNRLVEAYNLFQKGLALDPDDTTDLREGIKTLEQKAILLFDDAVAAQQRNNPKKAKEIAAIILKITTPDSATHKKTAKALGIKLKPIVKPKTP